MRWTYDDGGRSQAGFKGDTGDCVTHAIAIATGLPYRQVYSDLAERHGARVGERTARKGIFRKDYEPYLFGLGWIWNATMQIGSGCKVHLRDGELPAEGPIITSLSRHNAAVIDGVIHDIYDPSRDGSRCVYGYYLPGLNA